MYKYIGNIHLKLVYNVTKIGAIVYAIDFEIYWIIHKDWTCL